LLFIVFNYKLFDEKGSVYKNSNTSNIWIKWKQNSEILNDNSLVVQKNPKKKNNTFNMNGINLMKQKISDKVYNWRTI
jgi:hypothetical protein